MTSGFLQSLFSVSTNPFIPFHFRHLGPPQDEELVEYRPAFCLHLQSSLVQLLDSFAVPRDRHRRIVTSSCILASCICFACTRHSPIRAFPFSSLPTIWRTKHTSDVHISTSFTRPQFIHDTFLFAVTRLTLHPNPTYCRTVRRRHRCRLGFFLSMPPQACQAAMRPFTGTCTSPVHLLHLSALFQFSHGA